jgi:hypothetical protein
VRVNSRNLRQNLLRSYGQFVDLFPRNGGRAPTTSHHP